MRQSHRGTGRGVALSTFVAALVWLAAGAHAATAATLRADSIVVTCTPSTVYVNSGTACRAVVTDVDSGHRSVPGGSVYFSSTPKASFSLDSRTPCALSRTGTTRSECDVSAAPLSAGSTTIGVSYDGGDGVHAPGTGTTTLVGLPGRRTSTTLTCAPDVVSYRAATTCTATVTDTDAGTARTPTGPVRFTRAGLGAFSPRICDLAAAGTPGSASCQVTFTPSAAETATIRATYLTDPSHRGSSQTTKLTVHAIGTRRTRTTLTCNPPTPRVRTESICTATVTDLGAEPPSVPEGTVRFTRQGSGGFDSWGVCTLAATGATAVASCRLTYTATATDVTTIRATYSSDATHAPSSGTVRLTARGQ